MLEISLTSSKLLDFTINQINTFLPDRKVSKSELQHAFDLALSRVEIAFPHISSKYYWKGKIPYFNHLNTDHYAMFLYFLSNSSYKLKNDNDINQRIFNLNKILHSIDIFYEVSLPNIFLFIHPQGTVLGRAQYSDYFVVYQRCGVGSNHGIYPTISKKVEMYPGSSILGSSIIGENCKVSVGSTVLDENVPKNSIYIGQPKKFTLKANVRTDSFWR